LKNIDQDKIFEEFKSIQYKKRNQNFCNDITCCIPTFNAGPDFKYVVSSIKNQNINKIIIVDSESTDETLEIARKYDCEIYTIKQNDFSHSKARNFLLSKVETSYVFFTVQDAILSNLDVLAKMKIAMSEMKISALSDYQIPRSDADQYCYIVNKIHNDFFYNFKDQSFQIFDKTDSTDRKASQLDNVCTLYNANDLKKIRFEGSYAEDIVVGINLLKNGKTIGRSKFGPVIHSHSRPAEYFFRRSFVDNFNLKLIWPNKTKFKEKIELSKLKFNLSLLYIYIYLFNFKKINKINFFSNFKTRYQFSASIFSNLLLSFTHRISYFKKNSIKKLNEDTINKAMCDVVGIYLSENFHNFTPEEQRILKDYFKGI